MPGYMKLRITNQCNSTANNVLTPGFQAALALQGSGGRNGRYPGRRRVSVPTNPCNPAQELNSPDYLELLVQMQVDEQSAPFFMDFLLVYVWRMSLKGSNWVIE